PATTRAGRSGGSTGRASPRWRRRATPRPRAAGRPPETPRPRAAGRPPETPRQRAAGRPPETPRPRAAGRPPETPRPRAAGRPPETPRPRAAGRPPETPRPRAAGRPPETPRLRAAGRPPETPRLRAALPAERLGQRERLRDLLPARQHRRHPQVVGHHADVVDAEDRARAGERPDRGQRPAQPLAGRLAGDRADEVLARQGQQHRVPERPHAVELAQHPDGLVRGLGE